MFRFTISADNFCLLNVGVMEYWYLKTLYESDKYETLDNLKYVSETIINRLYSTFDSLDEEADLKEKEAYENSAQYFNPETMDETYGLDESFHEGVNHLTVHNVMKDEFLNSSVTWIFHLFEKDCNRIFDTTDGNVKKSAITNLGMNTSQTSLWVKCNSELRLIANTIKHGKGPSSVKLQSIKPELFKVGICGSSDHEIQLTISNIKEYLNNLMQFWEEFFTLALNQGS